MNFTAKFVLTVVGTASVVCGMWLGFRQLQIQTLVLLNAFNPASIEESEPAFARPLPAENGPATNPERWKLTFYDDFTGTGVNPTRWSVAPTDEKRTGDTKERQYYAPDALSIVAERLRLNASNTPQGGMPYTSGRLTSRGHFSQQYGWFEMRARLPKGRGLSSAFSLVPDGDDIAPLIDVVQMRGDTPESLALSSYWTEKGKTEHQTRRINGGDFSQGFHTFAVNWTPYRMVWYVDGVERARTQKQIPQVPLSVLTRLAVAGEGTEAPDATTFPARMEVEYIRVYQSLENTPTPPAVANAPASSPPSW